MSEVKFKDGQIIVDGVPLTLSQVTDSLEKAQMNLAVKRGDESRAQSAASAALNEVNKLQKLFDQMTEILRANSMPGTDWRDRIRRREALPG